jgi:hypothetical protein
MRPRLAKGDFIGAWCLDEGGIHSMLFHKYVNIENHIS